MERREQGFGKPLLRNVFCILAAMAWQTAVAQQVPAAMMTEAEIQASNLSCEECHRLTTPRIFHEHTSSAHGLAGVGCADCHGDDHRHLQTVTAKVCRKCHPEETTQFLASSHSQAWEHMRDNARYGMQPEVVRRLGCEECHRIGFGNNDGRCDFCHGKHTFSVAEAKEPPACYTCHMGPDHPQMEAYRSSSHHFTPATCASCHMDGTHNANANLERLRSDYIGRECTKCHDQDFTAKWMEGAAVLEAQGKQLVAVAKKIVEDLNARGLLYPAPTARQPNPKKGRELVLGPHMLYEDTSRAEKIFFEMKKYLIVHLAQGAYHQDFKMAAYQGLIPLQQHLTELQSEAELLMELAENKPDLTPISPPLPEPPPAPLYQATYESSFHGVLPKWRQRPTCTTCHDKTGTPPAGWKTLCVTCHTTKQADQFGRDLVAIRKHADSLRQEGAGIVAGLVDDGIIRKEEGGALQLGIDFGRRQPIAEVLRQRLVQARGDLDQAASTMVLGVAHSNPDYTHWYGNAPAKSALIEIRDAAHKLRQLRGFHER
ncbi:MAG: multiheme c-type cytochrome [Deltaproteobacteria bacterium]